MAINLTKGQTVNLVKRGSLIDLTKHTSSIDLRKKDVPLIEESKTYDSLHRIMVGLGWNSLSQNMESKGFFSRLLVKNAPEIDCDVAVLLCGPDGYLLSDNPVKTMVFFGRKFYPGGSIEHLGDNLTGDDTGKEDDEQIKIELDKIPSNIEKLVFVVNIFDGHKKSQHFGMLKNAYIRLVNMDSNEEICRYNLNSRDYQNCTGIIVGEVFLENDVWQFKAIDKPIDNADRLDMFFKFYKKR